MGDTEPGEVGRSHHHVTRAIFINKVWWDGFTVVLVRDSGPPIFEVITEEPGTSEACGIEDVPAQIAMEGPAALLDCLGKQAIVHVAVEVAPALR